MKPKDLEKRLDQLKKQARASAATGKGLDNMRKLAKKAGKEAAAGIKRVSALRKEIRKLPQ